MNNYTMTYFAVLLIMIFGCKPNTDTQSVTGSIITKAYMVKAADDNQSLGKLKYMESEEHKDGVVLSKTYYDGDKNVKGIEKFIFGKDKKQPTGAVFYDKSGKAQSNYRYYYTDGKRVKMEAYEGDGDELLRIERYSYDTLGNRNSKSIFNHLDQMEKTFAFAHDKYGNETKMVLTDNTRKPILIEHYEITEKDKNNKWSKKYGYINGSKLPSTYYVSSRTVGAK